MSVSPPSPHCRRSAHRMPIGTAGPSFLGAQYDDDRIGRIHIITGTIALGPTRSDRTTSS